MAFLEVMDGQGRKRHIELNRPRLLIGREPSCDIHLPHPGVSRRHAQLQLTDQGRWLLQDLRSRNHVYVDSRPVQQIILEPRKPFRIAEYWLAIHEATPIPQEEAEAEQLEDTGDSNVNAESNWLEQLQLFQKSLMQLEEPDLVLKKLAKEFRRHLQPQVLAIGLTGPDGYFWKIKETDESDSVVRKAINEAEDKVSEDHSSFQAWTPFRPSNEDTPSPTPPLCLLFPMKGRSGILGHVYLLRPVYAPLPKPLQRYLSLATLQAGLIWENMQLGFLKQNQIEIEKELHAARQIQIDLFPPSFEIDELLDAYAVNLPSARVSGDYYDLIRIGPHSVAFVIADAMGHGMPAALLMAAVRAALRMGLSLDLPWKAVFQGLDDLIRAARGDTFVTGMVGVVDLRTRELQLVSAGHPLPSVLVDGKPLEIPEGCLTRPWGLDIESFWEVSRLPLHGKRWSILCYTDGITDAAARSQRAFGARRISAYHQQNYQLSAEDLCQGLLSEVAVQPGTALGDDQTVLVLCSPEEK
jgi:serine phosphatase RsbU (regulator of sigma subunit)